MYNLSQVRSIQMDDLLRIGKNGDGGYVLGKSQIDKTKILLSFGIGGDWSFEESFIKSRRDIICHAFDYSVSERMFSKKGIIKKLIRFRFSKESRTHAADKFKHPFGKVFDGKNGFFHNKYLGVVDDEANISVPSLFSKILPQSIDDLSVFVKMDIEQGEFRVLSYFEPYYRCINGFAIEFHDLDILWRNFTEEIERLLNNFYVAHTAANDAAGYIPGTKLPKLLEITFINKQFVSGTPQSSRLEYPVQGLDFPNIPGREQLHIDFGE
jgi:hypothetical protein